MSMQVEGGKKGSQCILVLGMHRSGTSAATRCLSLLGMDVGSNLLKPDDVNSKGYWEHADAVRINDGLLEAFGLSWWSLTPLPEGWMTSDAASAARNEIRHFVRRDFNEVALWGIKDPRLCRTAPLWIEVLNEMGVEISAMFVSRAPLEVARSLEKAHQLSLGIGVLSWMQHLAEAERATRGVSREMVTYDQLLEDPVTVLKRVGSSLGVHWPIDPTQRAAALHAFLDSGLRNHASLVGNGDVPDAARRMDDASRAIAGGTAAWSTLSAVSDLVLEMLQVLAYRARAPLPDELDAANRMRELEHAREVATLYWAFAEQPFSEDRSVSVPVPEGRSQIELPIPVVPGARYRLDPCVHRGYYALRALVVVDNYQRVVWSWAEHAGDVGFVRITPVDRPSLPGTPLHVMEDDPQLLFSLPERLAGDGFVLGLDIERLTVTEMAGEFDVFREVSEQASQALHEELKLQDARQQREIDALRASVVEQHARNELQLATLSTEHDSMLANVQHQLAGHAEILDGLRRGQLQQQEAMQALLRRGLWGRLRRRLARTEFSMLAKQHLEVVRAQDRRYRVTGNDPIFMCESANFPLAPGWYLLTLNLEQHAGIPMQASLYPDYGPGVLSDPRGIGMPFVRPGRSVHRGLVRFAHPVRALRFDPAMAPCELSVSRVMIQRVSKLRAGWELYRAWLRPLDTLGKPRPSWRGLLQSFRKGIAGAIGTLYDWYTTIDLGKLTYDVWVSSYDNTSPEIASAARSQSEAWSYQPLISILVPAYNSEETWLRKCIESVIGQAYPHWELCVVDDASPEARVMDVLNEYAARDPRVHVQRRSSNGHISASSNTALAMATGEYVALLDHDDELHPLALHEVVAALQSNPQWKVIYSDEDKIDEHGHRYDPYMKPDWNYDLLLSQNCVSHLGVYQRDLVTDIGGFRLGFEGSQDWDLALRCIERLAPEEIGHVAKVLYHWRAIPGSTSMGVDQKDYTRIAALKALEEHLERTEADASVEEVKGRPGNFRVRYRLPESNPKVSLIIPTRDGLHLLRRCVDSILKLTDYTNYEIVIVDNQSEERETHDYFREIVEDPRVSVVAYDEPFNYSAINNYAVSQTEGELVGLINNDIEVISPDWLAEMASQAMRPGIGAVGAMLYYPDDSIQHAGVVLGVHGVAAHCYCGQPRGYAGQMGRARLVQSMSAVTAACLVVRREVFNEVEGLNETLRVAFNDIDFCLRVRKAGYRNLWTPFAELYHHESATRGSEDTPEKKERFLSEVEYMTRLWEKELCADPAYSPNLTLTGVPFDLAFAPRKHGK